MLVLRLATAGWLTTSQDQGDAAARTLAGLVDSHGAVNRIWPSPSDPYSTRGLGGGLTFAYDPSVCDELLPAFTESHKLWGVSFIDCDSIKQAIRSAFASWSANHPSLKFHDVTADCQATADWTGGPMGIGCSRAEIYLSTTTNATSIDAAATTLNEFAWDDNFHHPNGVRAVPGLYATRGSIIRFSRSNGVCWYLDSSFCEGFHRMKREMGADTVLLFGRLIIFVVWGLGLAWACWSLYIFYRKTLRLIELEREQADRKLRQSVKEALMEHRELVDDPSFEVSQMKTLLDSIARRRDPDAEEWTDNQVYAIQTRFEALVHKYHLLPGDPKAHRRRTAGASLPGLRGKKHVMSNAELRDATEEIFVQVVAEYESAHWTLSEEGSALWLEAFDKLRRINLVPLLTLVVTMITPLVFYYRIFLPCWECFDFQAAATHEVGHALGLTHPDAGAGRGLNFYYHRDIVDGVVQATPQAINCTDPWTHVRPWPNSTARIDAAALATLSAINPSVGTIEMPHWHTIMATFTFNNPSTCIFQDDLDALNVLYPTCSNAVILPQCDQPRTYVGWVRLAYYVGLPALVGLLMMVLCIRCTMMCHKWKRRKLVRHHPEEVENNHVEQLACHSLVHKGKDRGGGRRGSAASDCCSESSAHFGHAWRTEHMAEQASAVGASQLVGSGLDALDWAGQHLGCAEESAGYGDSPSSHTSHLHPPGAMPPDHLPSAMPGTRPQLQPQYRGQHVAPHALPAPPEQRVPPPGATSMPFTMPSALQFDPTRSAAPPMAHSSLGPPLQLAPLQHAPSERVEPSRGRLHLQPLFRRAPVAPSQPPANALSGNQVAYTM